MLPIFETIYKPISLLSFVWLVVVVVVNGQALPTNSNEYLNAFINGTRQQYIQNIYEFDRQLNKTESTYTSSLRTTNVQLEMLVTSLTQTNKDLNALKYLSVLSQTCIKKHQSSIPTVADTKSITNTCWSNANIQINYILQPPTSTRNYLDTYYKTTFEYNIANCERQSEVNYNSCIIDTIQNANSVTQSNQRTFAKQMNLANQNADENIRKSLQCSYSARYETIFATTEATTLINKCMMGDGDCKPCDPNSTCTQFDSIYRSNIDYNSRTSLNFFYGRYDVQNCLMIKVK